MIVILLQIASFFASVLPPRIFKCLKWVLRRVTGKGELERTLEHSNGTAALTTISIERSLKKSSFPSLNGVANAVSLKYDELAETVFELKHFRSERLVPELKKIVSFNRLLDEVETLRTTTYEDSQHEHCLRQLWSFLFPDRGFQRIGKHWSDVGFQGQDPATDFRGQALLGLNQLVYLTEHYPEIARQIFSQSNHPQFGFPFAIAGINLTALLNRLVLNGYVKSHFYNLEKHEFGIGDFHDVYCIIYAKFATYYLSMKPDNILAFNALLAKFETSLTEKLSEPSFSYYLSFDE